MRCRELTLQCAVRGHRPVGPAVWPVRWTSARTVRQAAAMSSVLRSIWLALVILLGTAAADPKPPTPAGPAAGAGPGVKTIIVIRHAEAEHQPDGDPALTADGRTRAIELGRVLVDTPLHAVVRTH